jgi:hypothetical protein
MYKVPLDWRSLALYGTVQLLNITLKTTAFDLKILVEILGSVAGFSTILYNVIKTYGEVRKFVLSMRWKRKHPKVKKDEELPEQEYIDYTDLKP